MTHHIPSAAELKEAFERNGIRPNRSRGQNFLIDHSVMHFIAKSARLAREDVVLEVGAGPGGLTGCLADSAGFVVSVEIDRKLFDLASEFLAGLSNLRLIHADIMSKAATEEGGRIDPHVTAAVRGAIASIPGAQFKVVANLPYIISTAFITAVLAGEPLPSELVVMVQKEVADRLSAAPGEDAYGFLSVIVQAIARVEILRKVSPAAFWPQPAVHSSIIRITPDAQLRSAAGDLSHLKKITGALFTHRRKQLARSLVTSALAANMAEAHELLAALAVPETERCERLDVAQFIQLAKLIRSKTPSLHSP